jgi:signal transduction histidine kinase
MLSSIGRQMDELIGALRSLARGIYPVLLSERGLVAAVRSAAQRTPLDVAVRASAIERYADEIEVAVYFCCLEAIQNVVKHAGRDAHATVHFWERGGQLHFRVTDSGKGFDPRAIEPGSGLVNMRDRVEAVGGRLTITSRRGCGSSVEGQVPIAPQPEGPLVT